MADYNTKQRRRNVVVGFFVLIAVVAFGWMIFKFGELPVRVQKMDSYEVIVEFPSAPGIQEKTPVKFCGFEIGKVTAIAPPKLDFENGGIPEASVTLTLSIQNQYTQIPSNSIFRVLQRSIGSSFIEVLTNPEEPVTRLYPEVSGSEYLQGGMELKGELGTANEFFPEEVRDKVELFIDKLTSLSANLDTIIGDELNQENIKLVLENVQKMAGQATDTFEEAERTFEQATDTFVSVENFTVSANNSLRDISDSLDDSMSHLNELLDKANNGEGTVGKLMNNGLLYEELYESAVELRLTLEQIKMLVSETREEGVKIQL